MKKKRKKDNFMPSVFDPLGMYGAEPKLPVLDEEPTQDADDL